MQPAEIVQTLAAEGVRLELSVRAKGEIIDDTRALIRGNRDALLEHLARTRYPVGSGLHLYGDLLHSLMVWVARYYEFRLEHPGGVILNAKPDYINDAVTRCPWGVLYTAERHLLLSWGNLPRWALTDKTELQPTRAAQALVTAERV